MFYLSVINLFVWFATYNPCCLFIWL